jgi:hypothetical protein
VYQDAYKSIFFQSNRTPESYAINNLIQNPPQ